MQYLDAPFRHRCWMPLSAALCPWDSPTCGRMHQTELLSCLLAAKVVLGRLMVRIRNAWETGTVVMDDGQTCEKRKVFPADRHSQKY